MKASLLLLLVGSSIIAASAQGITRPNPQDCFSDPAASFQWNSVIATNPVGVTTQNCTAGAACTYQVNVAALFTIDYANGYKVVRNLYDKEVSVLYPCGLQQPQDLLFEADRKAGNSVRYFAVPLTSAAVADSTTLYFMEALGVADRVNSVAEFTAVSPCMSLLSATKEEDPSGCDRVFKSDEVPVPAIDSYFNFGGNDTGLPEESKTIAVSSSADSGALNRAEWLGFVAAFFNKEDVAAQQFGAIKSDFQALATQPGDAAPSMLWVNTIPDVTGFGYVDGNGKELTGAVYEVSFPAYKIDLSESAGADMQDSRGAWLAAAKVPIKTSVQASQDTAIFSQQAWGTADIFAAIHPLLQKADIVIDETYFFMDPANGLKAAFMEAWNISNAADYPFLANSQLWRNDKARGASGTSRWFDSGVGRPDLVLKDLRYIVDPGAVPNHETYFFRNATANEATVTAAISDCSPTQLWCTSFTNQAPISPAGITQPLNATTNTTAGAPPSTTAQNANAAPPLLASASVAVALALVLALLA